jgi:hypothetical protein
MKSFSLLLIILLTFSLSAELKYEQSIDFSNFVSFDQCKIDVGYFVIASQDDPNIKVIGVDYNKMGDPPCVMYTATLTCYVSEKDVDFDRVLAKVNRIKQYRLADELEDHMR